MQNRNDQDAAGGQDGQNNQGTSKLKQCPSCGEKSLIWKSGDCSYECLNLKCKAKLIRSEFLDKTALAERRAVEAPKAVKNLRRGLIALTIFFIATVIFLGGSWFLTDNNLTLANALLVNSYGQLDSQRQEISRQQKINDERSLVITEYSSKLTQKEQALSNANSEINKIQTQLKQRTEELNTATNQITVVKADLKTAESLIAEASLKLTVSDALLLTAADSLKNAKAQLELYKQTYGSVVASDVQPPWERISLVNQSNAADPTYAQLQAFLLADKTDEKDYVTSSYVCSDFSRDVHNNAERQGIRAGFVALYFQGQEIGHACNVFKTTDRGLVFIDCTGLRATDYGPSNCDKIVGVKLGKSYVPVSFFPQAGWELTWGNMGTIRDVWIYW